MWKKILGWILLIWGALGVVWEAAAVSFTGSILPMAGARIIISIIMIAVGFWLIKRSK